MDQYLKDNIGVIDKFLQCNPDITEVWGAWGNIDKEVLKLGKKEVLKLLKSKNIKVFYFVKKIKVFYFVKKIKHRNPPHPLNRKIAKFRQPRNKKYLPIDEYLQ